MTLTLTQSSALGFTIKSVFSDSTAGATVASNSATSDHINDSANESPISWSLTDGDTDTGRFDYILPGSYLVTDTVTDSNGATATASVEVNTLGSAYSAVTPTRLLDTRNGTGAAKGSVAPNSIVKLRVEGSGPVPSNGVTAVVLNLTAVPVSAAGFVTAYPSDDGTSVPNSSSLNYAAGQIVANLVTVPVGSDGYVYVADKGGTINLIADISGYYSRTAPNLYQPATPQRLLDTRNGTGAPKGAVSSGGTVKLLVALGDTYLPPAGEMTAAAVNITVVNATNAGFVTTYADGASQPGTSNVNFGKGQIVSNNAVVPVAADGKIDLTAALGTTGSVDLVVDIVGYYSASMNFASTAFVPIAPSRVFDSRQDGQGQIANGIEYDLNLGEWAMPVAAVQMNATVTNTRSASYLNLYTYGAPRPGTSNLNWTTGQTVARGASVSPSQLNGWIAIYNASGGGTDLILDISGYFENARV
ncbi:hypothetical protein [Streptacidiphilus carbonis]|uniref:hypothetical protein n=1 Tax=Streptacidiphilus carbonis TaxID=105422 RepID=UPI0012699D0A|nr:hypothetical protein [Streptacidiphilus carbonis]